MEAEEEKAVTSRVFRCYGLPHEMVTSFIYLGRLILARDNYWPAVIRNMEKAREVWRRMMIILSREGARPRVYRFFFKAIIRSVLIFGAENWVVTPRMGRALGGFQDQVARQLTA